jgi:hypothetical protein
MNAKEIVERAKSQTTPEELTDPDAAQRFVDRVLGQSGGRQRYDLIRRLNALARGWNITLPLPQLLRPRPHPQPMRQADWAARAEQIFDFAERLDQRLADRHGSPDIFARLALASAILKGGLLRPEAWPGFCKLLEKGAGFYRAPALRDLVWLDLALPRKAGRAAQENDCEILRFFPDVVTLSLIARSKGARFPSRLSPAQALEQALDAIGITATGMTPETVQAAGFAAIEDESPQPIPAVLFEIARGALPAFSSSADAWNGVLCGVLRGERPQTTPQKPRSAEPGRQHKLLPLQAKSGIGGELSIRQLVAAVQTGKAGEKKLTRGAATSALERVLQADPVPVVRALILWSLDLLARGRALGTVRRYAPTLARSLLGRFGDQNPRHMSAAQIETLIEDALELVPRAERLYRAARIHQLFDFARDDPRLLWPQIDLDIDGSTVPRIRTALVSPRDIALALRGFGHDPVGQIAVLLAARGGLRLSDMEALRLGDVEPGVSGVLRIHPTLWGDLKTSSARRLVPFEALLTADELRLWNRFLELRHHDAASPTAPLLAQGGGLLPLSGFDRRAFAARLAASRGNIQFGPCSARPHHGKRSALQPDGVEAAAIN